MILRTPLASTRNSRPFQRILQAAAAQLATAGAVVALLGASAAWAQSDLHTRVRPVTGPIRHAGVYHLGTGTWTRHATTANVTGPDTIYDNTCNTTYYGGMIQNEQWSHRSVVPSPTHPVVPTIVPGGTGNDEAAGCQSQYLINGFQIAYCSFQPATPSGPVSYTMAFQDNYTLCGGGPMVPTTNLPLVGLPGGTSTGNQVCWLVDIDLNAATLSFSLLADGTGTYFAPSTVDQFGVRWKLTSPSGSPALGPDGPIIAGNYTWLGGAITGPIVPCQGTDGTIWDSPVNLAEQGTGMVSSDFFRVEMSTVADGCYFFGGILHADFHLELYSAAGCLPSGPGTQYCDPGVGGVIACPCGNAPGGAGMGCNNSLGGGGASISATGTATLGADTVVISASGIGSATGSCAGSSTSLTWILLQGNANAAAGVGFNDGVRCFSGSLKRIEAGVSVGGVATSTVPISLVSASLGDVIGATTFDRYYGIWYRDPCGTFGCAAPINSNVSDGYAITWTPGAPPGVTFCEPGVAGVIPCTCGNAPSGLGRGCNNSSLSGGATLVDNGTASVSADTAVLLSSALVPSVSCFVLQGNANIPAGVTFGDGVRCAGGTVLSLFTKTSNAVGTTFAPNFGGGDMSISARSALLGDVIVPGSTRWYQVHYVDTGVSGCFAGGGSTFNISSGKRLLWLP